jgi:hypothetical protein
VFEHIQRLRFYLYITLIGLPPALGCLWVLLARFGLVPPVPGLLWWGANAVAPWWLLAVALLTFSRAGWGYASHRLNPEIQRIEEEENRRVPAPRLVRERGLVGIAALLLAAAVLVPRQTPDGVLIWESSAIERQTVMGTIRQEEGKMMQDYADQRVWTCRYLTVNGISTRVHVASRGFPYCSYFIYRYPRS